MKRVTFLMLIFCAANILSAQNVDNLQATAADLYAKKEYRQAAETYEKILETQGVAPEIYYNLGNAYYKANETALAVLNYERALRLAPSYSDAKHNLQLAEQRLIDNIPLHNTFFLMRWFDLLLKFTTANGWLYISIILLIISILFTMLFVFGSSQILRKISFYTALALFIFCISTGIFSGVRKWQMQNHNEAIVMNAAVTAKSAPDKSGTDLFSLHEGTKVIVKSTLGDWVEIEIGNGNVGWLLAETVERI